MKKFIILLTLLIVGCGTSETTKEKTDTPKITQNNYRKASTALIHSYTTELIGELMKSSQEGGFANALDVCQIKAPEITDKFQNENYSIKRVTNKPRNIENKANEYEQEILARFADPNDKLKYYEEWKDSVDKKDYYFYKPIHVGALCLNCHGESKTLDKEILSVIKNKYPQDLAVDYTPGQLRGMFIINIKDELGIQLIDSLKNDSL